MHAVVHRLVIEEACPNSRQDDRSRKDAAGDRVKQSVQDRRNDDPIRRMHQDFGWISRRCVMSEMRSIHNVSQSGVLQWKVHVEEKSVHAVFDQRPAQEPNDEKPQKLSPVMQWFGSEREAENNNGEYGENPEGAKTI